MKGLLLIVDDNAVNVKLASEILRFAGFSVRSAVDAEHARTLLETLLPDLILTDIALPGMDGLALTRWIKADARLAHVPVVALTAFAMTGDEEKATRAGCDGYITKPIDTRRFSADVAAILVASLNRHIDIPC